MKPFKEKTNAYFPHLTLLEFIKFWILRRKIRRGYAVWSVTANGEKVFILDTFEDYKIADIIYLDIRHMLVKI